METTLKASIEQANLKGKATEHKLTAKLALSLMQFLGNVTLQQVYSGNLYIAFANDAIGTGFSYSPIGKTYVSFIATNKNPNDIVAEDFTVWVKFVGDKGDQGIQ